VKAIIIQDHDARALLDQLKLESFIEPVTFSVRTKEKLEEMDQTVKHDIMDTFHRKFHYIVTRWLQEQGCQIVR
jgi:hypothetical protein